MGDAIRRCHIRREGSQGQGRKAQEMACWRLWRFRLEHQPVLEIYHDDDAEQPQADEQIFYTGDTTPRVSKPKQSTDGMDLSKMFHLLHYVARFHPPTGQTEEMVAAAAADACLHP